MSYVDFKSVKSQFTIEEVTQLLGLEMKKDNGQLRCPCPVHDGGKRALVVTPAKESFYCFAPECRKGGDLIELYAHCKDLSTKQPALELSRVKAVTQEEGLKELDYLVFKCDQVQVLGLPEDVAQHLGAGYAPKGIMAGRVVFPLRDRNGKLVAYVGYSHENNPPMKLPRRFWV